MSDLQTSLFDPQYARESRMSGYQAAAPSMQNQNERVLDLLRRQPIPLSAKQIAAFLCMKVTSVHRVLNALGPKGRNVVEEAGTCDGGEGARNTTYRVR